MTTLPPNKFLWDESDLVLSPEDETTIVEVHVGNEIVLVREGRIESDDGDLQELNERLLDEYPEDDTDISMWVAEELTKRVPDAEVTNVYLPSDIHLYKSNTCHIPSGSKGGQFCSLGGGGAAVATVSVEFKPSAKMLRAMQARVPCGYEKQKTADEQERILSRAVGIPRTGDNAAFDLRNDKIGVEVKTMVDSKNGKITMSKEALAYKKKEIRSGRIKAYTVVADKRSGQKTQYYMSKGVGSFRINSMTPVTLQELRGMLR